jgi:endonuclease/exonuclease/phosphatase family metal-dependent hydrolase
MPLHGGPPESTVNLIVTNFSGGKRHNDGSQMDSDAVNETARLANEIRTGAGVVLVIQEMTSTQAGLPTRAVALERAMGSAQSSYVPRVSTAWYPLVEKWGSGVGHRQPQSEGLCVVTGDEGLVLAPWSLGDGLTNAESPTRVIDLPAVEFPDTGRAVDPDGWLRGTVTRDGSAAEVLFRPTYYQGNRDSDPRAAQACVLGWRQGMQPPTGPVTIVVNVHLSTLKREQAIGAQGRRPSAEASFQRTLQLELLARLVRSLRVSGDCPVIVAGDFNAEPDSPEMVAFAAGIGAPPLLTKTECWRCGTAQAGEAYQDFYWHDKTGLALTRTPSESPPVRGPVCRNDTCAEPRFTHKRNLQLIDNVFVVPSSGAAPWSVVPGPPYVDLSWQYSDHAAIVVPLRLRQSGAAEPVNVAERA